LQKKESPHACDQDIGAPLGGEKRLEAGSITSWRGSVRDIFRPLHEKGGRLHAHVPRASTRGPLGLVHLEKKRVGSAQDRREKLLANGKTGGGPTDATKKKQKSAVAGGAKVIQ